MSRTEQELLDEEMNDYNSLLNHALTVLRLSFFYDPNVKQMNSAMYDVAKLLNKEYTMNGIMSKLGDSVHYKFKAIMSIELPKLISDEGKLYAFELYDYFKEKMKEMHGYNDLGSSMEKNVMTLLCEENLSVHKSVRDLLKGNDPNAIVYGNKEKWETIRPLFVFDSYGASERLVDELCAAYNCPIFLYSANTFKEQHQERLNIAMRNERERKILARQP